MIRELEDVMTDWPKGYKIDLCIQMSQPLIHDWNMGAEKVYGSSRKRKE